MFLISHNVFLLSNMSAEITASALRNKQDPEILTDQQGEGHQGVSADWGRPELGWRLQTHVLTHGRGAPERLSSQSKIMWTNIMSQCPMSHRLAASQKKQAHPNVQQQPTCEAISHVRVSSLQGRSERTEVVATHVHGENLSVHIALCLQLDASRKQGKRR